MWGLEVSTAIAKEWYRFRDIAANIGIVTASLFWRGHMTGKKSAIPRLMQIDTTFEAHFSIAELAAKWKLSRETVRQLFKNEAGVVKVRNSRRAGTPAGNGGPGSQGC